MTCCFSTSWSPSTPVCSQLTTAVKIITPKTSQDTLSLLSSSSSLISTVLVGGGWQSAVSSMCEQSAGCLSCLPRWLRSILKCLSCCCKDGNVITEKVFCELLTRLSRTYGVVVLAMALTALAGSLEDLCKEDLSDLEATLHAECVKCYCSLVLAEAQLKIEYPEEANGSHGDMPNFLTDPGGNPFGIILLVNKVCSTFNSRISSCS